MIVGDPGYNESMADLASCIERALRAMGVAGEPKVLAAPPGGVVLSQFQGSFVYFPKLDASNRHARNAAIRRERERGTSISALAKRYRLTRATVYASRGKSRGA